MVVIMYESAWCVQCVNMDGVCNVWVLIVCWSVVFIMQCTMCTWIVYSMYYINRHRATCMIFECCMTVDCMYITWVWGAGNYISGCPVHDPTYSIQFNIKTMNQQNLHIPADLTGNITSSSKIRFNIPISWSISHNDHPLVWDRTPGE